MNSLFICAKIEISRDFNIPFQYNTYYKVQYVEVNYTPQSAINFEETCTHRAGWESWQFHFYIFRKAGSRRDHQDIWGGGGTKSLRSGTEKSVDMTKTFVYSVMALQYCQTG